jgi:hypothetical protein
MEEKYESCRNGCEATAGQANLRPEGVNQFSGKRCGEIASKASP